MGPNRSLSGLKALFSKRRSPASNFSYCDTSVGFFEMRAVFRVCSECCTVCIYQENTRNQIDNAYPLRWLESAYPPHTSLISPYNGKTVLFLLLFFTISCTKQPVFFPISNPFLGEGSWKGEKKNREVHSSFSHGTCFRYKDRKRIKRMTRFPISFCPWGNNIMNWLIRAAWKILIFSKVTQRCSRPHKKRTDVSPAISVT